MFKPSQPRMRHTYCSASTTLRQTPVVEGQPNKKGKPNNVSTSDKKLKALLAKELAACSADRTAAENELTLFGKEVAEYVRDVRREYQQALLMREIRELIFRRRYPQSTLRNPECSHQPLASARYYDPQDTETYSPTFTNL